MPNQPLYESSSGLLTQRAFDFLLDNEVKRATRLQGFVTLVIVEVRKEWSGAIVPDDDVLVELSALIGNDLRDTDLKGHIDRGKLALLLLDASLAHSCQIVDRLLALVQHYQFSAGMVRVDVAAASCPTDATDAVSLVRQLRPITVWRSDTHHSERLAG